MDSKEEHHRITKFERQRIECLGRKQAIRSRSPDLPLTVAGKLVNEVVSWMQLSSRLLMSHLLAWQATDSGQVINSGVETFTYLLVSQDFLLPSLVTCLKSKSRLSATMASVRAVPKVNGHLSSRQSFVKSGCGFCFVEVGVSPITVNLFTCEVSKQHQQTVGRADPMTGVNL